MPPQLPDAKFVGIENSDWRRYFNDEFDDDDDLDATPSDVVEILGFDPVLESEM